jgi:tape measure domain-containing protein
MARLNLPIVLKLVKDGVDTGIAQTQTAIRGLYLQVSSFITAITGGAFAIVSFINKLKEVTRETNRARITLKNVSTDAREFAESERWLIELGNKYGQSINNLERSFGKFLAASRGAGVEIDTVKDIFQGLTQAVSSFGLSSADANLAFLAVEQMMGKGVVSAEELRRQLGERIPTAMTAMARAVGEVNGTDGTIKALQKELKAGAINSAEVMGVFVKNLRELSGTPDLDNLETSYNRLGNKLREIVIDWDITSKMKGIVDSVIGFLDLLKNHFLAVVGAIAGAGFSGKLTKAFNKIVNGKKAQVASLQSEIAKEEALYQQSVQSYNTAMAKMQGKAFDTQNALYSIQPKKGDLSYISNRQKRIEAEEAAHKARLAQIDKRYAQQVARINERCDKLKVSDTEREKRRHDRLRTAQLQRDKAYAQSSERLAQRTAKAKVELANRQLQMEQSLASKRKVLSERLTDQQNAIHKAQVTEQERRNKVALEQQARQEKLALLERQRRWAAFGTMVKDVIRGIGAVLKSVLSAVVFGMLLAAVGEIFQKIRAWWRELHAVERAQKEVNKAIAEATRTSEIVDLEKLQRLLNDAKTTEEERKKVQAQINEVLGTELTNQKAINKAIDERIRLLKQEAKVKALTDLVVQAEKEVAKFESGEKEKYQTKNQIVGYMTGSGGAPVPMYDQVQTTIPTKAYADALKIRDERQKLLDEESRGIIKEKVEKEKSGPDEDDGKVTISKMKHRIQELDKIIEEADLNTAEGRREKAEALAEKEALNKRINSELGKDKKTSGSGAGKRTKKGSTVAEAEETYRKSLKEASNLHKMGRITGKKLREAESDAAKTYIDSVVKLRGEGAKSLPSWKDANARLIPEKTAIYQKIRDEHYKKLGEYDNRLQNGTLKLDEYNTLVAELITETINRLSAEGDLTDAQKKEITQLRESRATYVPLPKEPVRDATYDYKKKAPDIEKENLELLKTYIKALEEAIKLGNKEAEQLLVNAKAKAKSLEDLIKLDTIQKDLADLQDKRFTQTYQGIKSVASATRGAVRAFKQLRSVFEDDDASGLEKLFATFSSITSIVDSILSLIKTFKTLSETIEAVTATTTALDTAKQATEATAIAVSAAEVATSQAVQSAKMAEMAAIISARYAFVPGGQALASAEIAGYTALIAGVRGLGAFAQGGLVDFGSPTGDRTLIRVNKGERVLTSEHQAWLQDLAKGFQGRNATATPQQVTVTGELRVRGRDLVASIHNETRQSKR